MLIDSDEGRAIIDAYPNCDSAAIGERCEADGECGTRADLDQVLEDHPASKEELRQKVIERRALYDADEYDDEDEDWYRICNIWERKVPVKVLEPRLCDSMLSAEERQFLSEMGGPARGR